MPNMNKVDTPVKKSVNSSLLHVEYNLSDVMKKLKSMNSSQDIQNKVLNEKLINYEAKLSNLNSSLEGMIKSLNMLWEENKALKIDINLLREKISLLESTNSPIFNPISSEEIITEAQNRVLKQKNVIFYNIIETPNETLESSCKIVSDLIKDISLDLKVNSVKRLGKPHYNRIRPILVECDSIANVSKLLKNKSKLRAIKKWKKVYVNADLTYNQRIHVRNLKDELNRKRLAGEANLIIKFVKGVPTICPKN
ncbi:uncharacterized protein LOC126902750 [Daktulosphaira vitifoliae]|uniref:uncharacterized protein LOC126902750 n=1 Tax=Daktulosphaira vitifoliae TaxID=58002 RepID=UPI0021AB09F1|nr:uncharacterized protein LOC126902750 [Daktulosphaira vitifoliae]